MAALTGSLGFLSRLGSRERRVIALVSLIVVMAATAGGYYFVETLNSDLEADIEVGEEALSRLRTDAQVFMISMARKEALETAIKKNDSKIQTALDNIASKIELEVISQSGETLSSFDKVIRYDAKTNKRRIVLGEKKQSNDSRSNKSPYMEMTQPMEFSFVSFSGILAFLNTVENPGKLMYVSKLEVTRKLGKPSFVMGSTSVSTYIYEGKTEEESE
jgi:hypothetical protein